MTYKPFKMKSSIAKLTGSPAKQTNILPTVNTDGYITVKVEPEVSTIFEFIGPDQNIPRVKSRTSSSTIRVKDGESIVIGGLLSNDKKQTTYKFPYLHRIPWLGKKLFTSQGVIDRKTDLIIQITPKIVVDAYTGIEKSDKIMWPDCSPPKLNFFFFIKSFTYLSPTFDLKNFILFLAKNFSKP